MTYENRSIGGLFLNIGRSPAGSCLLDEHLDADVLAHNESGAVQEEKRQKAAHAAVSVIERVDAEEVQDEYRHQDQRIIGSGLDEEFLAAATFVEAGQQSHDLRREKFFGPQPVDNAKEAVVAQVCDQIRALPLDDLERINTIVRNVLAIGK